jgi:tetratricopeptide (TPR) repeat protein
MKRQEALAFYQKRVRDEPSDADAHHNLAVLYMSMGDVQSHSYHSRLSMLTKQPSPPVWNEQGLALMQQGKLEEARLQFEQVINRWPNYHHPYVNIAAIYARKGKYKEALPYCEKALKLCPNDASIHRNAAKVYEMMGRTTEALAHYHNALKFCPNDPEIARKISLLSVAKAQMKNAHEYYDHYRRIKGDHYDFKI